MSSAVESEIVSMKFENTQFEKGVSTTLSTLDKLKSSLKFPDATSGLDKLASGTRGFNMNPLVNSAGEVGKAFSAMSVTAISAIATVASQATNAGLGIAKSLTISPISSGFSEYETQMGSIQTILANTGLEGDKGLAKVNAKLNELNHYSDKTIYNFTEMASNIGTFTAAGVDLDTSTAAIKGIANLAAVSGSTSVQASTAMYQLSQALSAGKVSLMDWNSVVNAGLGGKVFKDALTDTARAQGIAVDDMIKKNGSFRDSLQEGWITGEVLTKTLAKFTGDLSKEQLIQQGYTSKQADEIVKLGKMSADAATKVKTLSQLMDTLKEAVGSGWSKTFSLIFGDFNQAKKAFTSASNTLGGLIQESSNHRNKILKDWSKLNGRTVLILGIKHAWEALGSVIGPIKDGFREIFPASTGKDLKHLTAAVNRFFKAITLSADAQDNLKRTFAGLFAVIHIGFTIFSGIVKILATLIGMFFKGQGSTLAFTGSIGDMLVALDKFLTRGNVLKNIFAVIQKALVGILGPLLAVKSAIIDAFVGVITADPSRIFDGLRNAITGILGLVDNFSSGFANAFNAISNAMGGLGSIHGFDLAGMFGDASSAGATKSIDAIKGSLDGVATVGDKVRAAWGSVLDKFDELKSSVGPILDSVSKIAEVVSKAFSKLSGGASFGDAFSGVGPAISEAIQGAFTNINFNDIVGAINIAVMVAIYKQFKALTGAFTDLADSASGVLNQVTSNLKTMQADVKADIILKIAASLALLAAAVYLLAQTNPKQLGIALAAVAAMMLILVAAMKNLEKATAKFSDGAKMIAVSTALAIMAVALAAMAGAVYLFSLMDPGQLARGLIGVTLALAALTASAAVMSKSGAGANMIGAAIGLTIMSAALVALAGAIELYSRIDPDTMKSGIVKIGAALLVLAIATRLMNGSVGGAVAMVIIAGGLIVLAKAIQMFADMPTEDIKKGLTTVAASLIILVVAMNAMQGGILGAGALLLMVAALTMLIPVIIAAGQLSWETIGKGLLVLVGSMLALALAAAAISPVIPVISALATAILLIGGAVFLAGAGIALFAAGLAALAINGNAGFGVLITIIDKFLDKLPDMVLKFGDTISAIATVVGDKAPELVDAFAKIIVAMLDAGTKIMPRFGVFMRTLLKMLIGIVVGYIGDLVDAGIKILMGFLHGIEQNIGDIVDVATNIIIKFINALARNGVKLANAGLDALVSFLNGLANAIETHSDQINSAGIRVAKAIINGVKDGVTQAASEVAGALQSMLSNAAAKLNPVNIGKKLIGGLGFRKAAGVLTGVFAQLVGDSDKVTTALGSIKDQLKDTLDNSKKNVKDLQKELTKLKHAKDKDPKKIAKVSKELKQAQDLNKAVKDFSKADRQRIKDQSQNLRDLAAQYDVTKKAADDAQATVDKYTSERDALRSAVNSTFGTVPDIQAGQSLASYMRTVAAQQAKVDKFHTTLDALRAQGLDDASYRQFLAEGVDAQRVMDGLLQGGPAVIQQFEQANQTLQGSANSIAVTATSTLRNSDGLIYDQAIITGQAVVDGLLHSLTDPNSIASLTKAMTGIAQSMMAALNGKLKIHSPSRATAEVATFMVRGLTNQLDSMHGHVARSTEALATAALDTLQATMSNLGNGVGTDLSLSPVITPVLDLTQLAKDANGISSLLDTSTFVPSVSFAQASDISTGRTATDDEEPGDGSGNVYLTYEQNNYSPDPIDPTYVYRQTNSQLSRAREALKANAVD